MSPILWISPHLNILWFRRKQVLIRHDYKFSMRLKALILRRTASLRKSESCAIGLGSDILFLTGYDGCPTVQRKTATSDCLMGTRLTYRKSSAIDSMPKILNRLLLLH